MAVEEKKEDYKGYRHRSEQIKKAHESKKGSYSGFPPNITVDELWIYRKRRPAFTWPKDNLKLEEGEFKHLKSEYKRRFKNFYNAINKSLKGREDPLTVRPIKPEISLKLEGLHDFQSEYNESYTEHHVENLTQPSEYLQIMNNGILTSQLPAAETTSQINTDSNIVRPRLLKRPTNLKIEGDFLHVTEYAEKFIEYLLAKRSELLRTPTTLRLEGEMDTKTETKEQYIKYDNIERPPLCKKFSNLHLEGTREIMTEKQEKFMPFELTKRPPLTKKSTNLYLEGDLNLIPEYRREYIDYKTLERPKLILPANNLKIGGLFESISDELHPHDRKMHPLIPFLREPDKRLNYVTDHRLTDKTHSNITSSKSASHPSLNYVRRNYIPSQGNMEIYPEYKKPYIDFDKQGKILPKVESRRHSELNYMKENGQIEGQPEYSSSYINFPRRRPSTRKPEDHLSSAGELYHLTEKNDKYTPHAVTEKTELLSNNECERKVEERFQCQPEYRKAYIDYLIRERKSPERQRAFELVHNANEVPDHTSQNNTSDSELTTIEKEIHNNKETEIPKPVFNIPTISKPSTPGTSSVTSTPQSSTKLSHSRKLSQIEASAFGPRCIQSRVRRSLTPSSTLHTAGDGKLQVRSRNSSPKLITERSLVPQKKQNLYSPTIKEMSSSDCTQWSESADTDTAFLVLDERVPNRRIATKNLYKEQKWMPSWNYSNQ